ncbi:MAG: hypothetical protein HY078_01780 [Elusimicrobia bacterium]|nr:hypothetical protein [Elusimicrobiota bacterium]
MNSRFPLLLLVFAVCCGCAPAYSNKGEKFENLTINRLLNWPAGADYIEGVGAGRPADGEKDAQKRRLTARNQAILAAQRQLISQLEKIVARDKIKDLLRRAEVAKMDYGYDDACSVALRIPKETVEGKRPIE